MPAPARIVAATIAPPRTEGETSRQTGPSPRPHAPGGMAALNEDAVALHAALGEARSRSARLVSALRGERRRSRLLASTIAQLRQIRLQDVAGQAVAQRGPRPAQTINPRTKEGPCP